VTLVYCVLTRYDGQSVGQPCTTIGRRLVTDHSADLSISCCHCYFSYDFLVIVIVIVIHFLFFYLLVIVLVLVNYDKTF